MPKDQAAPRLKAALEGAAARDLRDLLAKIQGAIAPATAAYLVGGAVRDLLNGSPPADLDLAVAGDASAAARAVASALEGHAFALDEPRQQHRILLGDESPVRYVDIAPLAGEIEADLAGRDFTIDAMAAQLVAEADLGALVDPLGGERDIEAGIVRMTAEAALGADPLRLLRAVRLACELDFQIEPETAAAVGRLAGRLSETAPERQRDELVRILGSSRAAPALHLLDALGLLAQIVPELTAAHGVDQPRVHYWDVFDHSIETVAVLDALTAADEPATPAASSLQDVFRDGLAAFPLDSYLSGRAGGQSRRVLLKLAGLLHDVAKPETKGTDAEGRVHFLGHPELGAAQAARICARLRFGNRETRFVSLLVEEHLRPFQLSNDDLPSHRALYRYFRDLGEAAPACLILSLADAAAAAGPRLKPDRWQRHVAYVAYVLDKGGPEGVATQRPPRLLTGDDLMRELGLAPGPLVGRILAAIDEAAGSGEIGTQAAALALAAALKAESEAMQARPGAA